MPSIHNIADDVLVDGKSEVPLDKSIITQVETAKANNITFNCGKFVFKSKNLGFFGGNLTSEGCNIYPRRCKPLQK